MEVKQYVTDLVRHAVSGSDFNIHGVSDWNELQLEINSQALTGLWLTVWKEKDLSAQVMTALRKEVLNMVVSQSRLYDVQNDLLKHLEQENIPAVIIKGASAAVYYPDPDWRVMGDVDVLVKPEDRRRTVEVLLKNGYTMNASGMTDRHTEIYSQGVEIEIHDRFVNFRDEAEAGRFSHMICQKIEKRHYISIHDMSIPVLPDKENGLVLLQHMRHHLAGGVGLRHVLDWMMYIKCWLNTPDKAEELLETAEEFGLRELAMTATRLCVDYLGLRKEEALWCMKAGHKMSDIMMDDIFDRGNFGRKVGDHSGRMAKFIGENRSLGFYVNRMKQRNEIANNAATQGNEKKRHWITQMLIGFRQLCEEKDGVVNVIKWLHRTMKRRKMLTRMHANNISRE